jgi:hypothetical protein
MQTNLLHAKVIVPQIDRSTSNWQPDAWTLHSLHSWATQFDKSDTNMELARPAARSWPPSYVFQSHHVSLGVGQLPKCWGLWKGDLSWRSCYRVSKLPRKSGEPYGLELRAGQSSGLWDWNEHSITKIVIQCHLEAAWFDSRWGLLPFDSWGTAEGGRGAGIGVSFFSPCSNFNLVLSNQSLVVLASFVLGSRLCFEIIANVKKTQQV